MYPYSLPNNIRKVLIIIVPFVIALVAFLWFFNHSYIEITVTNPPPKGDFAYTITNQLSGRTFFENSGETSLKQRVSKGNYVITVTINGTSYFTVAKTGGFLSSTEVSASLKPEKLRTFIGNNPGPCMSYDGDLLFSYGCGSSFAELQVHQPATSDLPSLTQNPADNLAFIVEGVLKVGGSDMVLLQNNAETTVDSDEARQYLYTIDNNLDVISGAPLKGVASSGSYGIKTFKDGYLLYSSDLSDVLYYKDFVSEPERISITDTSTSDLSPLGMSVKGSLVAKVFSSSSSISHTESAGTSPNKGRTIVMIYDYKTRGTNTVSLPGAANYVELCGSYSLCVINNHIFEIYKIEGGKVHKSFVLPGVSDIAVNGNTTLAVSKTGVIEINPDTQEGFYQYTFGSYKFCGIQPQLVGGYVLCLINNKGGKYALYINPKQINADSVDKKVYQILQNPDVSGVSPYKNYIYITPDLGQSVYDPSSGGYTYDQSIVESANKNINQLLNRIGLDVSKYKVVVTN